jgi:hypothetical protein
MLPRKDMKTEEPLAILRVCASPKRHASMITIVFNLIPNISSLSLTRA